MQTLDPNFITSLAQARDGAIAPVYFLWLVGRDIVTDGVKSIGFWTGDEDLTISVVSPDGLSTVSRSYYGGCNLSVDGIQYVSDLTDNAVSVSLSQITVAAQEAARNTNLRLAHAEIHATTMNGGAFVSAPQLQWVGIVDEGNLNTPAAGGGGEYTLSIRSEIMHQLTATNPAKSSDAHQKRRSAGDRFCEYSSTIEGWDIQWYKS
ncbi:hypothetical protein [Celeribacter sp.]|uniref:hypothetical protein n=1 Tax=Celeribacter sp. TaxID=1890673 RepID=UPI003A8EEAC8